MASVLRQLVYLFYPIGLLWVALILLFLRCCWKRKIISGAIVALLIVFVSIVGGTPFSDTLLRTLEQPYYHQDWNALPKADAVVLLGGNLSGSALEKEQFNASANFDRVLVALELLRDKKAPVLVIGGITSPVGNERLTEGQLLKKWFERWSLTPAEVIPLGELKITRDEARQTGEIAKKRGWKKILLVTSAYHMDRALLIFAETGLEILPVACDFRTAPKESGERPLFAIPSSFGFEHLEIYLHETIGLWAFKLFGA
jgi:uncharacterized SAM-binding protein YcdF (DUF218 family)